MSIHRYVWKSVNLTDLVNVLPASAVPTISGEGPQRIVDINLVDDAAKPDLDDAMAALGWTFVESSPATTPNFLDVKQVAFAKVTVDTSTSSAIFTTLLSVAMTTGVGFIDIVMDVAVTTLVTGGFFRLVLDAVPLAGGGRATSFIGTSGAACTLRVAVGAGAHTILLEWRASALGTVQCRPVTFPDAEGASLYVAEIAV